jgi:hypothetical protein
LPREVFVAGQVLTAAELNVVSDQSVMVFAGTAARGSAIPSPSEGMVTYRSDDDVVEVFDGSVFAPVGVEPAILQVVSTTLAAPFSATSSGRTLVEVTGLNATITPSSTSSKVFMVVNVQINSDDVAGGSIALYRDATQIALGNNTPDPRTAETTGIIQASSQAGVAANFLDSPATTSAVTYKVFAAHSSGGGSKTWYVNRSSTDAVRTISTITLMEVAG